jgi:hypothetical protein
LSSFGLRAGFRVARIRASMSRCLGISGRVYQADTWRTRWPTTQREIHGRLWWTAWQRSVGSVGQMIFRAPIVARWPWSGSIRGTLATGSFARCIRVKRRSCVSATTGATVAAQ